MIHLPAASGRRDSGSGCREIFSAGRYRLIYQIRINCVLFFLLISNIIRDGLGHVEINLYEEN